MDCELEKKGVCIDCGNKLYVDSTFYLMGWIKPHPDVTLDDEMEHNEDFGPFCCVCFKDKKRRVKERGSPIEL